jgi:hypothetical protein
VHKLSTTDVAVEQVTGQSSMCSSEYEREGKQEGLGCWVGRRLLVVVKSGHGCSGSDLDLEHEARVEEHSIQAPLDVQ